MSSRSIWGDAVWRVARQCVVVGSVVSWAGTVWAAGPVIINEIHYDPDVKTDHVEFIELYNRGTNAVDLSGWAFTDGIEFTFPSGSVLAPDDYAVVAEDPSALQAKFGYRGAYGPYTNSLSAEGETITLRDATGDRVDTVDYKLGFPWPTVGDPPGYSIELIHPDLDNDLGGHWRASTGIPGRTQRGPTPGRRNSVYATNAPPAIRQVKHSPRQPRGGEPVLITAKVTDADGVTNVVLHYQLVDPGNYIELTDAAYQTSWTAIPMRDDGLGGDEKAGDDVYTVMIPGLVQMHRRLVRYRIVARDGLGESVQVPYADDPQPNFAYFVYDGVPEWRAAARPGDAGPLGEVVTYPSEVMSRLPVLQLLGKSNTIATATWFSRYSGSEYRWLGTLVYNGEVYDHVAYRARGGVWRYSMVKNMWKFDMNRGHYFQALDNWGRPFKTKWDKVNLGACIQQGNFDHRGEQGMFEAVGFRLFELAGVEASKTAFITLRVIDDPLEADPNTQYEGDFWGLYLLVEQMDGRFLDEHDLPDSNFYKMEGGSGTLNNLGPNGPSNKSDLNWLLNNYSNKSETWWRTNWNLLNYYSYQTIVQAIHHYDINAGKNYFYYYHPELRVWQVHPWDLDLTWAHNMFNSSWGGMNALAERILKATDVAGTGPQSGTDNLKLTGAPDRQNFEREFRNRVREIRDLLFNEDQAWELIDEYAGVLRDPNGDGPTILEADRAMWDYNPKMIDSRYTPNLNKAGQGRFWTFPRESRTNAALKGSFEATVQIMKHYVGIRSQHLDELADDPLIPKTPVITYTGPAGYPINRLSFRCSPFSGATPSSAFASMKWRVGEVTDPDAPDYIPGQPHAYEIEAVWESGPITNFTPDLLLPPQVVRQNRRYRIRVQFLDNTGRTSHWSDPIEFVPGEPNNAEDLLNYLRITEVMYHPLPGGFEYVELHNTSSSKVLDLSGVKFTQGIEYIFPVGTLLRPNGYLLLVDTDDLAAFRAYYGLGSEVQVLGPFAGSLSNGGEQLTLRTSAGGTDIVSFTYGDSRGWPIAADGAGHSLVLEQGALAAQGDGAGQYPGNWRASTWVGGSPGAPDPQPEPSLLLNEIAANTPGSGNADSNDWIELYNPTDQPITLGMGWYLSDDPDNLRKWMIPADTTVPGRGWVRFDEATGFHADPVNGFGLSRGGEQVFLSYLPSSGPGRVVDSVRFKAQERDWTWGRYPDGGSYWYALQPPTPDAPNAVPPARVVISEILYHPPDLQGTNDNALDEFIEVFNATAAPVTLQNTNGPWRLDGGVAMEFPADITLAPGEYLLVVNFNPVTNPAQLAAFRATYGLTDTNLQIVGPYLGKLDNSSDRVALEQPLAPAQPGAAPDWAVVDEVIYADQSPWPCGSDGTGASLQRLDMRAHGSDPLNWVAQAPTPGVARLPLPPGAPTITAQPRSQAVPTNATVTFTVGVCGVPPFTYRWFFEGQPLPGQTNATLQLTGVGLDQTGDYTVEVANQAGATLSQPATLIVQLPPRVTQSPASQRVVAYTSTRFEVQAEGTPPLQYQWQFNGANLTGATNATLVLTNIQKAQEGLYRALVINSAGVATSAVARLTVDLPATITVQPESQTVIAGTSVTLSVSAFGTGTLRYQWRKDGVDLPGANSATLLFDPVQAEDAGTYQVVVTDDVGAAYSDPAVLVVLVRPEFVILPQSQTVLEGQDVVLSATVIGTPPLGYRWRRNGLTIAHEVSDSNTSILRIPNVQLSDAGRYTVIVTNAAFYAPGIINRPDAVLTVLADHDRDGMADAWEVAQGFDTNRTADALLDADGDLMSNRDEYQAGTDPHDPASRLWLQAVWAPTNGQNRLLLRFTASSNHSYTVWWRDSLRVGAWERLTDVEADPTPERLIQIEAPVPPGTMQRFYQVETPKNP